MKRIYWQYKVQLVVYTCLMIVDSGTSKDSTIFGQKKSSVPQALKVCICVLLFRGFTSYIRRRSLNNACE